MAESGRALKMKSFADDEHPVAITIPSDDIRQADFSGKRDEDLTDEERAEVNRRFQELYAALRGAEDAKRKKAPEKKKIKKWDPRAGGGFPGAKPI